MTSPIIKSPSNNFSLRFNIYKFPFKLCSSHSEPTKALKTKVEDTNKGVARVNVLNVVVNARTSLTTYGHMDGTSATQKQMGTPRL